LVPDVFTAREIARAAGVPASRVRALIAAGRIVSIDGRFVAPPDAVAAVRTLCGDAEEPDARELFRPAAGAKRAPGLPLAASGALHGAVVAILALLTAAGAASHVETEREITPARVVFLAIPGPGGGGGGGGLRQPAPPPRALLKDKSTLRSPVPVRREVKSPKPEPEARPTPPPVPTPVERPVEPPPPVTKPDPLPPVVAPVASAAADPTDRAGVLDDTAPESESHGSGTGGGTGSGRGTGIGEGDGAGIGPGSGGGMGGGPYRPGSGITAPSLVREVKPAYTEDARRRGLEGAVELEIVVRRDGSVGEVRLLRGLGGGLDQRAADAVRQWRFAPARRFGTPVDVMVEVAVEFRLR
jgi:TonB family protein